MQSVETTPRFRNLSVTPHFRSTSFSLIDEKQEEKPNLEKQCFMCRQANVYIKPIGMQQERRIARRHPPPLSRAQIEELSEKKYLTKREVRTLLQCYFPEIKNVKYFQLHKYHSCCYDPKHLNLCKNHITALQREREQYPNHHFHEHQNDEKHLKEYEKNGKNPNRVSFVRIKIEPTKGIPTRFLGPTALPESLADMLIKQVNRFENKKKLPTFNNTQTQSALEFNQVGKLEQPYENGVNHFSEHLVNLDSDDDDDDHHDDDDDSDSYSGSDEENTYTHTPNSNIHGYTGQIRTRSRMKYERQLQTQERKEVSTSTHNKNGDLIVEDVDDLTQLYVHEQDPITMNKTSKGLKKKKRRRRRKRRTRAHQKPKLNHWEIMALDHSQQEVCGCRHHVRRLEADQVVYDWCRCKDHTHKGLKERRKSVPPPPAPPPSPPQKPRKVRKKNTGINATEPTTTELALAYDPTTVDYDVIQEVLYYRTSSGRLVKPEITNRFGFNNVLSGKGHDHRKLSLNNAIGSLTTSRSRLENVENHSQKNRSSMTDSPILSNLGSGSNDHISKDTETHRLTTIDELLDSSTPKNGQMYGDDEDDNDDDDDDGTVQFMPPKYLPEIPEYTPTQSPTIPTSIQKSSKPTYMNQRPTPNFDRESSLIANRRWFDQPLGDQNLDSLQDGRYGLIAGTTTENYQLESQMPDNDYVEPIRRKNRSNCTIS